MVYTFFQITESVYSYINLLKKIGPQERIYNELKLVADTAFQFASEQSASDTVQNMCESMQYYPSTDYITGSDIFYEYNEHVRILFNKLGYILIIMSVSLIDYKDSYR